MKQLVFDILKAIGVIALLSLLTGLLMTVAFVIFFLVPGRDMDFQVNYTVSITDVGIWISALATSLALVYAYQGYVEERKKSKVEGLRTRLGYALLYFRGSQVRLNKLEGNLREEEGENEERSSSYYKRIRQLLKDSGDLITEISEILAEYKGLESTKLIERDIELKLEDIEQSRVYFNKALNDLQSLSSQKGDGNGTGGVRGKSKRPVNLSWKSISPREIDAMVNIVTSLKNSQLVVIQWGIESDGNDSYGGQQIDPIYRRILLGTSTKNFEKTVFKSS